MLKKILPVGIGIVLILLITLTISLIKKGNDRLPTVDNADEVYASYGDYDITYDKLYTTMKNSYASNMNNCYGLTELINLVDSKIYKTEVENIQALIDSTNADDLNKKNAYYDYVLDAILGIDHEWSSTKQDELETIAESWNDVVTSLNLNNIITKAEANQCLINKTGDPAEYNFTINNIMSSKAWEKLLQEYKLSYARREWAKAAYLDEYFSEYGKDGSFVELIEDEDDDNYSKTLEYYYDNNYSSTVYALYIPFTSYNAALKAMARAGINTTTDLLSKNGWVDYSYNYYTDEFEDSDYMDYSEVLAAFIKMYNEVYGYQNVSIATSDFESVELKNQTAYKAAALIQDFLKGIKLGNDVTLNNTYEFNVNNGFADKVTITLNFDSVKSSSSFTVTNPTETTTKIEVKNSSFTATSSSKTLKATININAVYEKDGEKIEQSISQALEFKGKVTSTTTDDVTTYTFETSTATADIEATPNYTPSAIDACMGYNVKQSLLDKEDANENIHISWTEDLMSTYSALDAYLCPGEVIEQSATLYIPNDYKNMYKTYTIKPVSVGDYYALILLINFDELPENLYTVVDGETVFDPASGRTDAENNALKDEIIASMKEDLYTDNNIAKMVYEHRNEYGFEIYDRFLEAIYSYNYDYFFGTTLSETDYDEFNQTKHNQKKVVAKIKANTSDKKATVEITAQDLFDVLEAKYASTTVSSLIRNYILTSNKDYNPIYNTYTNSLVNDNYKEIYRALLTGELNSFQKNFEAGYFTYSSLSSYFVPNFPSDYGWSNFIKDYFNAYTDQELLTSPTFGGSLYRLAYELYSKEILTKDATITSYLDDAIDEHFDVTVVNLLIQIDPNYDSTKTAESDNWTQNQLNLANDLVNVLISKVNETGETTLYNQLNALVKVYNECDNDTTVAIDEATDSVYKANFFAKYKAAGLQLHLESASEYTDESSIVEEFATVCKDLYNNNPTLHNKEIDNPLAVCSSLFETSYGYHKIFVTEMGKTDEKPANYQDLIDAYYLKLTYNEAKESLDSAKEYKETYAGTTYEAIYDSQVVYYEFLTDLYNNLLRSCTYVTTNNISANDEVTFNENDLAWLKEWYCSADESSGIKVDLDSSYEVIKTLVTTIKNDTAKVTFTKDGAKAKFDEFLDICLAEYNK